MGGVGVTRTFDGLFSILSTVLLACAHLFAHKHDTEAFDAEGQVVSQPMMMIMTTTPPMLPCPLS